jgi:hypothetical protein
MVVLGNNIIDHASSNLMLCVHRMLVKSAYDKGAKEAESAKKKYEEASKNPNSGLNALKNMMSRTDGDERVEKVSNSLTTKASCLR